MGTQMTQKEANVAQIVSLGTRVTLAMPALGLTFNEAQAHLESGVLTEVVKLILKARPEAVDLDKLREMLTSYRPFGNEEFTGSGFSFSKGFPRLNWEQRLEIILENFPNLSTHGTNGIPEFIEILKSQGVESWVESLSDPFIIPDWQAVAPTYSEATVLAWSKLAASKVYKDRAHNYRESDLTEVRLKLVDEEFYQQLAIEWGCKLKGIPTATAHSYLRELRPYPGMNVWPVFAQTGLRHRGRSVRRGYVLYSESEWALGPFEVACILLTDGEDRLTNNEHLAIDAPGAFYRTGSLGVFGSCVNFCFGRIDLELYTSYLSGLSTNTIKCGSATASLCSGFSPRS